MLFPSSMTRIATVALLVAVFMILETTAKRQRVMNMLQKRETNAFTFIRLFVMRLVYGIAKMMGYEDEIGDFMDGAFVPPGAEDDDDFGDWF